MEDSIIETKSNEVNLVDKINELEKRVEALEKVEHRRKVKNIIVFSFYGVFIIAMIIVLIILYNKLKPYKDTYDSMNDFFNGGSSNNSNYGIDDYTDFFNEFFN